MAPRGTVCAALAAATCLAGRCLQPVSGRGAFVQPIVREVGSEGASLRGGAAAAAAAAAGAGEAAPRLASSASATVLAAAGLAAVATLVAGRRQPVQRATHGVAVVALGAKKSKGGKGKRGGAQDEDAGGGDAPEIDTESLIQEYETKMSKSVELLRDNFVGIRAGQATPKLLDGVKVKAYDSEVGLNEVGTVTIVDTRTLAINIFDDSVVDSVDSSLRGANLGYSFAVSGAQIKVTIPELTKDKRTQYAKMAKDFAEKSRSAVRSVRQNAMKKVKGLKKDLSEDVAKSLEKEVEDLVKKNVGDIDKMLKDKESELMKL